MSEPETIESAEAAATAAPPRQGVGRTRAGQSREQQLIRVAAKMFFERGYDATTLQDVADELGLLKGSLYYYIKSKDDLLYAVIDRQHREAMALIERCSKLDLPPEERLRELIRSYASSLENDRIFVSVYLRELNRLSPERRKVLALERKKYAQWVVDTLKECQKRGTLRRDFDPEIVTQGILGMLNTAYRWYRPSGAHTPEEIIGELLGLIFRGLEPDSASGNGAGRRTSQR